MILRLRLTNFLSQSDERRLFQGLKEIPAIRSVHGVRPDVLLVIEMSALNKGAMRELLALLTRFEVPLMPLRVFAEKRKFDWLNDPQGRWHSAMFQPWQPELVTNEPSDQQLEKRPMFRLHHQRALGDVIAAIVLQDKAVTKRTIKSAMPARIPPADQSRFVELVLTEFKSLHDGNCVRFGIRPLELAAWQRRHRQSEK